MSKSKSHKEDEDLRGKLREVEKENKALRKRLKKLERSRHVYEQFQLDKDEITHEPEVKEPTHNCPSCNSGTLLMTDLGIKWLWVCSSCLYRKTDLK